MNVFEATSVREYLGWLYHKAKDGNSTLNLKRYADRIGVGHSSLKMMFAGQRLPTVHQVLCFAKAHSLSVEETSYLESLALKEAAQNSWETTYYTKLLQKKKKAIKLSTTSVSKKDLLADPMTLPILVYLQEKKGAVQLDSADFADELAVLFGVTSERVKQAIELLLRAKVLQPSATNRFHVAFDHLNHRGSQKQYLLNVMKESNKRLQTDFDRKDSLFSTYVLSADEDSLLSLQSDIKALMEKYLSTEAGSSKPKQIAQASFQVYSVSSKIQPEV